ncbi:hypothetical protein OPT61_g4112 [Boeremia exigua]|uniref:Uncharacterized protein n=1 Tax=Boeremia exigua TaxID=749465 RepID=A0ACC2IFC5_9PLEO|nr:hypothetical protein OPT61_g4112 [Boeremia exigua]
MLAGSAHHSNRLRHSSSSQRYLCQVYPTEGSSVQGDLKSEVDIIAVHGLDTRSPETWDWNNQRGTRVNWLSDLLPEHTKPVRIFTCDWPAELLQGSSVPVTLQECAEHLRESIAQHLATEAKRPILFIASCLGGIILMKALEMDNQCTKDSRRLVIKATRGIVFLATPFRGTAFRRMPVALLRYIRYLQDAGVTSLIDYALDPTDGLEELEESATHCASAQIWPGLACLAGNADNLDINTCIFLGVWLLFPLATGLSALMVACVCFVLTAVGMLNSPFHPIFSANTRQLVDQHSATLSDFASQRLDRTHVMMNKFAWSGREEGKKVPVDNNDFVHVSRRVQEMLQEIRRNSPLQEADERIRSEHYALNRLKIERLSGEILPMEQCYINLAIIQDMKERDRQTDQESGARPILSPFSLTARLKVKTPDANIQVQLSSLFDSQKDSKNEDLQPRRILIRGRAGVGKTTLCKKNGSWLHEWRNPQMERRGNLETLLLNLYFNETPEKDAVLARELAATAKAGRTLFILDGLDEISGRWNNGHHMSEFLCRLLNQRNVITTIRPHVSLPAGAQVPDLELETIRFHPDQVENYIRVACTDRQEKQTDTEKVNEILEYIRSHQMIEGLNFDTNDVPDTVTEIYEAISLRLWQKDIGRRDSGVKTEAECRSMNSRGVNIDIEHYSELLEAIAFSELYSDVLDFDPKARNYIYCKFDLSATEFDIEKLSFLRTSDLSQKRKSQQYHFLHLTFQEYFAAKYYVRRWKAKENDQLICLDLVERKVAKTELVTFLQEHKYDPRYNVFWRFVAGLLNPADDLHRFFEILGQKPRDILGPAHQRLIMHCLSEAKATGTKFAAMRSNLEARLQAWLLYECETTNESYLARDMEFPEGVLVDTLNTAGDGAKAIILGSLSNRSVVPKKVIEVVRSWIDPEASSQRSEAVLKFMQKQQLSLSEEELCNIVAMLKSDDRAIRDFATELLQSNDALPDRVLTALTALVESTENKKIQIAAIEVLLQQNRLAYQTQQYVSRFVTENLDRFQREVIDLNGLNIFSAETLCDIGEKFQTADIYLQHAIVRTFHGQTVLAGDKVQTIVAGWFQNTVARIETQSDDYDHRIGVFHGLDGGMIDAIATYVKCENRQLRETARSILRGQSKFTTSMLQTLLSCLEHRDAEVQSTASYLLRFREEHFLDITTKQRILELLDNGNTSIRQAVLEGLQWHINLPEDVLKAVVAQFSNADDEVRKAALVTLRTYGNLPEDVLGAISAQVHCADIQVRLAVLRTLEQHSNLSKGVLRAVVAQINYTDNYVRERALEVLQKQSNLAEETLQYIASLLEESALRILEGTIRILCSQSQPTDDMLQRIVDRLRDKDEMIRAAVVSAFKSQDNIGSLLLQEIVKQFKHERWSVRHDILLILKSQGNLTVEMLQAIVYRLGDKDESVQRTALEVLQEHPNTVCPKLHTVIPLLDDQNEYVRREATKFLRIQTSLSVKVVTAQLSHERGEVREAAIEALQRRGLLDFEVIEQITACLEDNSQHVRETASKILIDQAVMSPDVLTDSLEPLYRYLLREGFRNHVYWCFGERNILSTGVERKVFEISKEDFYKQLRIVQSRLEIPDIVSQEAPSVLL